MDLSLIRRCQAGDVNAFNQIFEGYKNLVFHTAFLMLDSADDAEDVLQDVFIQVYYSLNSYDPSKGAFSSWLHRIAVNKCFNRRLECQIAGSGDLAFLLGSLLCRNI